jgi:CDP-paratose 2-epimerase
MNICIVTGSGGLIGSESVSFFADKFDIIVGIDNDMRSYFFGQDASTSWNKHKLEEEVSKLQTLQY